VNESTSILAVLAVIAAQVAIAFWLRASLRGPRTGQPSGAEPAPGRRGDDYRAYQAVASEVAKRQVAVLAEVAEAMQRFERACFEHGRRLCELLAAEWRRAGAVGVPDAMPNDLNGAMRFFVLGSERALDDAAQHRIRKDLEANVTVLQSFCEATTSLLESNIFWLGMTLEGDLRRYVTGMGAVFTSASAHPRDLKASAERFRALMENHPDASRAIEQLCVGALRTPAAAQRIG
jgi:hypothetical protein